MSLPEPRSTTGCATCPTSRCCVAFDPEVTGFDVLRLVSLGLDIDDIAELRPTRADQAGPDAIFLGDVCAWDLRLRRTGEAPESTGHFPDPSYRALAPARYAAGLRRGALPFQDPRHDPRRCGFLVTFGGRARCGVYASRPMVCRLFPSAMTPLGIFVDTPETICPPNAFAQERSDLATLTVLHRRAVLERAAFRTFVAVWNALSSSDAAHFHSSLLAFSRALATGDLADSTTWPDTARASLSSF